MDWTQLLVILGTIAGLFLWNRTEGRTDARKNAEETKELRRELIDVMREIRGTIDAMKQESKDFHGRLCAIEERNKGK